MSATRSDPSRATAPSRSREVPASEVGDDAVEGAGRAPEADPIDDPAPSIELRLVVALAVIAGLGLRFVARSPLWLDEALSANIAKLPLADIPDALRHDGHPPLYYVLLHAWMQVAGTTDVAVRALSGAISVLTLPLAYLAGRRVGGRSAGWITLGLFALTPFVLRYATETRMYALVMLLVLAGFLVLDDVVRRGRSGWARVGLLAVIAALLLYSHYWSMWLLAAVGIVLLVVARRSGDPSRRRGAWRGVIGVVLGGVLFLPWAPTLLWQSAHTGTPWAGPVRPTSMVASTFTDLGGGGFTDAQIVGAVLFALVLLGVFGRAIDGRHIELDLRTRPRVRAEAAVVVLTVLIGLGVSYASGSTFVTRYAAVFVPLLLLIVATGILCFRDRWVRSGVLVVVLGLFGLGCVYNVTSARTQARVLAQAIDGQANPGDLVVFCPDQLGPATLRELRTDLDPLGFPTTSSPERIDWEDYVARNSASTGDYAQTLLDRAGTDRGIYLVWSGTYKTHKGTCDSLIAELEARLGPRPAPRPLVSEDGDTYYEHANLLWFPPVETAAASAAPDPTAPPANR